MTKKAENEQIEVIIPVYRPGASLRSLLEKLEGQTRKPAHILLVNTEESLFDPHLLDGIESAEVIHIKKAEFDHGGTRHMAAMRQKGAFLLFLTQDAVPEDEHLIESLAAAFEDPRVGAAYARQLPNADCSVLERFTRDFNYPPQSRVKTAADLSELGIKTFFCSNVCAMYRRSTYEALGGFVRMTIFNEDMIFAGTLIQNGYAVAYCADAKVIHSHNYSGREQFHRNFDLGVSQAEHPEIFSGIPSEKEGIQMVKQNMGRLLRSGKGHLIPVLIWMSACKLLGYRLGKNYRKLPVQVILACTMNKEYWR